MSQPPPYGPVTLFVTYQAQQAWFPGQNLDVEFNNIHTSIAGIEANLALLQKDDGTLANSLVGWSQLTSELQAAFLAQGFIPPSGGSDLDLSAAFDQQFSSTPGSMLARSPSAWTTMGGASWNNTKEQLSIVSSNNDVNGGAVLSLTKQQNGSVLDLTELNYGAKIMRVFSPPDIANTTPITYIANGGNFATRSWITISGHTNGLVGDAYLISDPNLDAFMIGVWPDVAKGIVIRGNPSQEDGGSGAAAMVVLNAAGFYTGSWWYDGTLNWGSATNADVTKMDCSLTRMGAGHLQLGVDGGAPIAQTLGAQGAAAPIVVDSSKSVFLLGTVLHFAGGVPGGVAPGQTVTDVTSPGGFLAGTTVASVDGAAKTVTLNQKAFPYAGDVIAFNGTNTSTLTNLLGATILGLPSLPGGVTVGQVVTDSTHPTAIPGATTVASIDAVIGYAGFTTVTLSAAVDGTLFNTPTGSHDALAFSTPNTAGGDLTLVAGAGTGTGAGGKFKVSAVPAGSTGSAQNSAVNYLLIDPGAATGTPETQVIKGLKAGFYATAAPNTQTGATYAVGVTDTDIIANRAGTITLTLPTAANFIGRVLRVKTIQAQTVVSDASNVAPMTSATPGTAILAGTAGKWADLKSDGTNWIIMAGN